jgi:hypothetical protein
MITKSELLSHLAAREIQDGKCFKAAMEGEEEGTHHHTLYKSMMENAFLSAEVLASAKKAAEAEELAKAMAEANKANQVSGVAPTRPGITAVPRAGMQPMPVAPNVPRQFEKLVAIPDDEQ